MHNGRGGRYDVCPPPPPPPYHFNHVHTPPSKVIVQQQKQQQKAHREPPPSYPASKMTTTNDNVTVSKRNFQANEDRIHVHRLECASDGGILDMDDVLEEVFDLNYDQVRKIRRFEDEEEH